jgi:alpha-beta hydrolase superfamily lysophospholipase
VTTIWLEWALLASAALVVLAAAGLAAAIAFGTAPAPKPMQSVSAPMAAVDYSDMPDRQHFQARDGARLSFRLYPHDHPHDHPHVSPLDHPSDYPHVSPLDHPSDYPHASPLDRPSDYPHASPRDHPHSGDLYPHDGGRVVVLIHGSSGESSGMHAVARALVGAGFAVYVPDLRGHAEDGRLGDIDYAGQLDDDLVDLMQVVRRDHPRAGVALVGHSSGGGFVLRIAEGPHTALFDRYVLLAPALHFGAPTWRPGAGGWATAFVPRIIGLTILDRFGVTWFQHLPVVAFGVDPKVPVRLAPSYSFVMLRNFAAPDDDLALFAQVRAPVALLAGEQDEIFYADRFPTLLGPQRPGTTFRIVPGVDHMGLITRPEALAAIVATLQATPCI